MENLTITIKELKKMFEVLIAHLEECGIEKFELTDSLYWDIPQENLYDPYKTPKEKKLTLGDLYENWNDLEKLKTMTVPLKENDRVVTYDLYKFSTILRWMGHKLPY